MEVESDGGEAAWLAGVGLDAEAVEGELGDGVEVGRAGGGETAAGGGGEEQAVAAREEQPLGVGRVALPAEQELSGGAVPVAVEEAVGGVGGGAPAGRSAGHPGRRAARVTRD